MGAHSLLRMHLPWGHRSHLTMSRKTMLAVYPCGSCFSRQLSSLKQAEKHRSVSVRIEEALEFGKCLEHEWLRNRDDDDDDDGSACTLMILGVFIWVTYNFYNHNPTPPSPSVANLAQDSKLRD